MYNIHTIQYYWVIKRNEILIHATISINLENISLRKRIQKQETSYYIFILIWNVQICKAAQRGRETERVKDCRDGGGGNGGWLLMDEMFLFGVIKMPWK